MIARKTLTVAEAAQVLGVSRTAVYDAVRQGQIPHLRLGARIVIPAAKLYAMLGEVTAEPGEATHG